MGTTFGIDARHMEGNHRTNLTPRDTRPPVCSPASDTRHTNHQRNSAMSGDPSDLPLDQAHGNTVVSQQEVRRVTISSYLGNTIEYYDHTLFASAAALVFGPLFFSNLSPALGTMASFAILATGYVARPLGGVVFGYLGDRYGRKSTLLMTMTIMGVGSGLIGFLPTYDQVGAIAPILLVLLRILQGFSVGGEWGGAALMTAEHAPDGRRGLYTAIGQAGMASGGVASTLVMALTTQLPDEQLFSWGWRVPFLLSFGLLIVGLYMRLKVTESPLFVEYAERGESVKLSRSLLDNRGALLRGLFASLPSTMSSSLFGSFAVSFAVGAGHSRSIVLTALAVGWALSTVTMPLYGSLSDRVGRRTVYISAALTLVVIAYPFFWAINTMNTALLFLAFIVVFAVVAIGMQAVIAALLTEMFPTESRYTAVSISYQGSAILGGLAPVIATSLITAADGGAQWVAVMVAIVAVLGATMVWTTVESSGKSLSARTTPAERPAQPAADPVG
ncbi:MAG: MFS transporter [Rhodococcus sp. (in: high G+C Gram-positive bacteria)]|nr:MAG: MFS transporter [Rhodococcus sp. (in: high G+C Gram-positive bacteria)]